MRARLLLVVCMLLTGCGPGFGPESGAGEGPGRRQQELALTPQQELDLGRKAYREILSQYHGHILPLDDPKVEQSRRVTSRIIKATGIEPLQRETHLRLKGYRFEWEVNVLQSDQINAFCLPGGKIAVFTGLFRLVQNDDQLATVLSHEIAHALAHHASERVAREHGDSEGSSILGFFINKKHDREQEKEADHIGVFLMTFAGYDPRQAIVFWEHMAQAHAGRGVSAILSDHPTDEQRIRDMQEYVRMALAGKKAFDEGRVAPAR